MDKEAAEMLGRLQQLGISWHDAIALRRIAMTLQRWHELECGDSNNYASWCITRGRKLKHSPFEHDDDGSPFMEVHYDDKNGAEYRPLADRERGALKRLNEIVSRYPELWKYVQTDPRGASLYIGQYNSATKGSDPELFYNSGVAVFK